MAAIEQAGIAVKPAQSGRGTPDGIRHVPCRGADTSHDAVLARAMRMIDPEIARSFSPEQRRAVRTMLDLRFAAEHLIDVRHGFSLAGRRYFLALLLGRERRRLTRTRSTGLRGWLADHALMLLGSTGVLVAIFLVAALLRG